MYSIWTYKCTHTRTFVEVVHDIFGYKSDPLVDQDDISRTMELENELS